jgi:hypothetical protein
MASFDILLKGVSLDTQRQPLLIEKYITQNPVRNHSNCLNGRMEFKHLKARKWKF